LAGASLLRAYQRYWSKTPSSQKPPDQKAIDAAIVAQISKQNVELFVQGVFLGFGQGEMPDLVPTIQAAENMYAELVMAFQCLHGPQTEESMKEGIGHLANGLRYLQQMLQDAQLSESELQHVIDIFRNAQHIIHAGKEIIVDRQNLIEYISKAQQAWSQGDYKGSGTYIGQALALLVG